MKFVEIAVLTIWVTAAVGWGMNIYKLISMLGGEVTTWFIARVIGVIFAPLGSVLGFF